MKGAAEFFLEFLVPHQKYGWLVTNPSTSPENFPLAPGNDRFFDEVAGSMVLPASRGIGTSLAAPSRPIHLTGTRALSSLNQFKTTLIERHSSCPRVALVVFHNEASMCVTRQRLSGRIGQALLPIPNSFNHDSDLSMTGTSTRHPLRASIPVPPVAAVGLTAILFGFAVPAACAVRPTTRPT